MYNDLYIGFNEFKSFQTIKKAFENGLIDPEIFEKAQRTYINNAENKRLKRVGLPYGSKKQDEPDKTKDKKPDTIESYAKKASDEALQAALKESKDEKVKEAAQKELDSRKTKENPTNKEQENKEAITKDVSNKETDFKKWFGDSKVVSETGKPLKVYHGTNSEFNEFEPKSDNRGIPETVYFSDSKKTAKQYGRNIVESFLKIENPLEIDMEGESFHTDKGYYKYTDAIKEADAEGYDGVIAKNMIDTKEPGQKGTPTTVYVVFKSDQIKKAKEIDKMRPSLENTGGDTKKETDTTGKDSVSNSVSEKDIKKRIEDLSDKYKNIISELQKPETFLDENKLNDLSKQQLEIARFIGRTNKFKDSDLDKGIEDVSKLLGLKDEKQIKDFFGDGDVLGIKVEDQNIQALTEDAYIDRWFDKKTKTVEMNEFILNPDLDKSKGTGSNIFNNQVQSFKKLGFLKLKTSAAKGELYNGYYTWARLGYTTSEVLLYNIINNRSDDKEIKSVNSLPELMSFQKGRDFWRKNGTAFDGEFDLSDDSQSMFILNTYMKENGKGKQ